MNGGSLVVDTATVGTAAAGEDTRRSGLATMIAGICLVVAPPASEGLEWMWMLLLVGFAGLVYGIPGLHRYQAPADGAVGDWGAKLVRYGGGLLVALGLLFLIWEAVGTPPDDAGPIGMLWMIGFLSFLIGMVLFSIGTIKAKVLPQAAAFLVPIGLLLGVGIDMATGAFFEGEDGGTTEWGFFIGVPLAGLGLAWMGYEVWKERGAAAVVPPTPQN